MQQKGRSLKALIAVQVPYFAAGWIQDRYLENASCRGCRQYHYCFDQKKEVACYMFDVLGFLHPYLRAP